MEYKAIELLREIHKSTVLYQDADARFCSMCEGGSNGHSPDCPFPALLDFLKELDDTTTLPFNGKKTFRLPKSEHLVAPCKFCGREGAILNNTARGRPVVRVHCLYCGAAGPVRRGEDIWDAAFQAIIAWNTGVSLLEKGEGPDLDDPTGYCF